MYGARFRSDGKLMVTGGDSGLVQVSDVNPWISDFHLAILLSKLNQQTNSAMCSRVIIFIISACQLRKVLKGGIRGVFWLCSDWIFNPIQEGGPKSLPHCCKISRPYLVQVPNYWMWTKTIPQRNCFFFLVKSFKSLNFKVELIKNSHRNS